MPPLHRPILALHGLCLVGVVVALFLNQPDLWRSLAVAAAVLLPVGLRGLPAWRGYQYTAWIIAAVVAAMIHPAAFLKWGAVDLRNKWIMLTVVQLVMFGMGTQMKLRDFAGVARMPWGVIVAVACQFLIMPLTGFTLTKMFSFTPEIAAGIILIGCCSSGLASNVMCYLARANLALSITATAITTLIAPLMTPMWMKILAGTLVEVRFVNMMMDIVKMVLVPIGAALLHDYLKHAPAARRRLVHALALLGLAWLGALALGGWDRLVASVGPAQLLGFSMAGFLLAAVVVGVAFHHLAVRMPKLEAAMPVASMAGIVYFTTVTTAAGRDNLLHIGALLFVAAVLHNSLGYFFGYWLARACRLDRNSARTVAIEVGLQNGGMASGLAGLMGKLGTVGLAAAIFSPWMNISGSVLANFWKRRPVE